jgi:bifunctional DNase/RNase
VALDVVDVVVEPTSLRLLANAQLLVLRERTGARCLVVPIGPAEAAAIAVAVLGLRVPRPLPPDLLAATLTALGATVQHVHVHLLVDGIYHTRIVLRGPAGCRVVAARLSDAVALAVRLRVPIRVEEPVFHAGLVVRYARASEAGRVGRVGTAAPADPAAEGPARPTAPAPAPPIPEAALAPYRAVVDALDLDDL